MYLFYDGEINLYFDFSALFFSKVVLDESDKWQQMAKLETEMLIHGNYGR